MQFRRNLDAHQEYEKRNGKFNYIVSLTMFRYEVDKKAAIKDAWQIIHNLLKTPHDLLAVDYFMVVLCNYLTTFLTLRWTFLFLYCGKLEFFNLDEGSWRL